MNGATISKMVFYLSQPASGAWNAPYEVYLSETTSTTLTGLVGNANATKVFSGTLNGNASTMEVPFNIAEYEYGGGNLLVGFYETDDASYSGAYFYGKSESNAAYYGYTGYSGYGSYGASFIPRTTFTYEPAQEGDCDKPETLVAEALSSETATLNWGGGSGTYNVEIKGGSYTDWSPLLSNTTEMTTMVENLTPNTAYQVRVQSVCTGETPTSGYKTADFTTPMCDDMCAINYELTDDDGDGWNNNGHFNVVNAATDEVIAVVRLASGSSGSGSFQVCDGMNIRFVWITGSYDYEDGYTFMDFNGDVIFSGQGAMTSDFNYTVSCVVSSCLKPNELGAVTSSNEAELSWTARSGETSWSVFYKKVSDANYTEVPNVTDNPYTLESLDANTDYQYYVVANCSASETSDPSEVFPFTTKCDAVTTFPWTENFESMTANTVPMCWDNSATTGTDYGSSPWYYWGVYEYNGNKMMRMHNYYAHGPLAIINSPIINLPAEAKELTFDYTHNASSGAFSVKISEDGGTTFTELKSYTKGSGSGYTDPGTFTEATISLADYANKSVILQFYSAANYGQGAIFVDNIKIDKAPTCLKPTMNAMASDIEATQATVSWTAGGTNQDHWDVYYSTTNTAPTASTVPQIAYTTDNPCTLTGLSASTTYYVWVRGNCGTVEEPDYSDWSSTYCGFTTKAYCADMLVNYSSIGFADITDESVTVNFTGAGAATVWKVQLSTATDFSANLQEKVVTTATASFDGLEANKTHYVRVAPYCDEADDYTPWTSYKSFKTTCGIVTIDETHLWEEGFEDYNVGINANSGADVTDIQCWERVQVSNSTPKVYRNFEAAACNGLASLELKSSSGNPAMIALPMFSAPIKDLSVAFTYNCTDPTFTYTAELGYISNVTDASTFVKLFDLETPVGRGSFTNYWQDLYESAAAAEAPAGSRVAIRFVYNSYAYNPPSWNFDDFQVSYVMGCRKPVDLTYAEVKSTSVKLNWVKTDDVQTSWEVAYCDETATPAVYQFKPANTNVDFVLEGLDPEKPYKVKVRTNCGTMEEPVYSGWSNEISFTTLGACFTPYNIVANNITSVSADLTWTGESDSYNVMYREVITAGADVDDTYDFEDGTQQGWTTIDADGHGNAWSINNASSYANNSNYSMKATYNSSYDHQDYLVSPQISLGGTFSFYTRRNSNYGNDTFRVYLSTTGNTNASDFNIELTDGNVLPSLVFDKYTYDLSNYSGNGYVAIVYTAPANQYWLYVDDINYTYSNEGEYGNWQDATSETEAITLEEGLEGGKTYEVKVQGVCNDVPADWSEVFTFTTLAEGTKVFVTEGNWNEGANWVPAGAPAINDNVIDNVIIRANATIPSGCVALAAEITVESGNTITIEDGGQLLHDNAGVEATMKKVVAPYSVEGGKDNYIFLASPIFTPTSPANVVNMISSTQPYDLYRFDQTEELEWRNYKQSAFNLESGTGYLYAHNYGATTTLSFTGELLGSLADKSVNLDYSSGKNWAGWNLIGNPFACNANVSINAEGTFNYYTIDANGDFVDADGPVAPMEGIFVEATAVDQQAVFTRVVPGETSVGPTDGILNVNLMSNEAATRKGNSRIDMARLRFGHGNKLGKLNLFGSNAIVFFPQDGKDYSVMYAEAQGEMPLHFKTEKNGTYTLGFSTEDISFGYLHLIDNLTGNDVDLLATPSYTFDARTTDYASRFRLVFSANGTNGDDETFAFISNGNLIINGEGTLQIIDVLGRQHCATELTTGNCQLSTANLSAGVYMLRLINGTNVKVQKIVVK